MTIQEFLFDVDGTLTKPRNVMTEEHSKMFGEIMFHRHLYSIVSGSDYQKLQEQLPESILMNAHYVFASMGNDVYQYGKLISNTKVEFPEQLILDLEKFLLLSPVSKTGNHIEYRSGMINFSIIGRNCNQTQRDEYYKWDKEHNERKKIVDILKSKYSDFDFCIGGMISIDIIPKGKDKAQVLTYLDADNIMFFGDRIVPGGNDWSLAQRIMQTQSKYSIFQVDSCNDTFNILVKFK